jgi:hypothetical protein
MSSNPSVKRFFKRRLGAVQLYIDFKANAAKVSNPMSTPHSFKQQPGVLQRGQSLRINNWHAAKSSSVCDLYSTEQSAQANGHRPPGQALQQCDIGFTAL